MKWLTPVVAWISAGATTVGTAFAIGEQTPFTVLIIAAVMSLMAMATSSSVASSDRPRAAAPAAGDTLVRATAEDVR